MSANKCPIRVPVQLPTRQQQVLRMIGEELSTKEIALSLSLSEKTVAFHRKQLMHRTQIFNQIGLAKLAIRLGMVIL